MRNAQAKQAARKVAPENVVSEEQNRVLERQPHQDLVERFF
jgi:hypothetical protein